MRQVELSEELLAEIWRRADPKPFENLTVEVALRRAFEMPLDRGIADERPGGSGDAPRPAKSQRHRAQRAARAELLPLVEAGLLRNGEVLFLLDYQRNRVPKAQAVVSGSLLNFDGRHATMSNLAQELLSKVGFESRSVRGPAHWVNENGVTILDLWRQYLKENRQG